MKITYLILAHTNLLDGLVQYSRFSVVDGVYARLFAIIHIPGLSNEHRDGEDSGALLVASEGGGLFLVVCPRHRLTHGRAARGGSLARGG